MGNFEAKKRKNKEIALKKQLKTPKFGSILWQNSYIKPKNVLPIYTLKD